MVCYASLNGGFNIVDDSVTEKIVIWQGYQGSAHSKTACKILQWTAAYWCRSSVPIVMALCKTAASSSKQWTPAHCRNCSWAAQGTQQRAQGVYLTCKSDGASTVWTGTSLISQHAESTESIFPRGSVSMAWLVTNETTQYQAGGLMLWLFNADTRALLPLQLNCTKLQTVELIQDKNLCLSFIWTATLLCVFSMLCVGALHTNVTSGKLPPQFWHWSCVSWVRHTER